MVRSNSSSKFLEVREEALHWAEEDEKMRPSKRNVSSEAVSTTQSNKEMDKVLQALEEQRESGRKRRPKPSLRGFDERGNRICFKCQGVGHIARDCVNNTSQRQNDGLPPSNGPPRNTAPPSSYVHSQDTSAPNGPPPQSRDGQ
ncbi:Alcohol dehydrogenase class-3 [Paramuricea clavata]|uniref:Alcohol dehydrogenase class-3 n=1 Tax=Paramuricea clavata TaxID=317549 RepID=A0A6S7IZ11_PARCT|nr:Alcohol dehydrogenase class-3 [Paramuricea clavata]